MPPLFLLLSLREKREPEKKKRIEQKKLTSCSAALRSSSVDFPENMGPVMISIRPTAGWSLTLSSQSFAAPRQAEATTARLNLAIIIVVVGVLIGAAIVLLPKPWRQI